MTILQIFNKYQYPGGEEASVLRVADTLGQHHKVIRCYFESREWADRDGWLEQIRQALAMVYNRQAILRVMGEIQTHKPDLILMHNLFPICSAAMFWKLVRCGIPTVQFIHNFRPFSVNGYCWVNDRICDRGLRRNFFPEILGAGWQDSSIKTAWYAAILWGLHITGSYRRVTHWMAISAFMKEKFVEAGVPGEKITELRHSWNPKCGEPPSDRHQDKTSPYFLYLGRLSSAKGLHVLIDAWKITTAKFPDARLVIGGEGPMEERIREVAAEDPRVEFRGMVAGEDKARLLDGALAMVVPSTWWEPLGIVVYEAYDHSIPALVAASGGLKETVVHGKTGLLHPPGDSEALASDMIRLLRDPEHAEELGRNGRIHLLDTTKPSAWLESIERVLAKVAARPPISVTTYLADQNPKLGRSLGISRMTDVVIRELSKRDSISLSGISSASSVHMPEGIPNKQFPWSTRSAAARIFTDHLHPILYTGRRPDVCYFPKGFLPKLHKLCSPSVVTIHDTIVQYYADHYPQWRTRTEYGYWAKILKHTLRNADHVLTVSQSSKQQILDFMERHEIPGKEITVTYEPCLYESIPQPANSVKGDYVLHLASREPHKRTAWLVDFWLDCNHHNLPELHVVGTLSDELEATLKQARNIRKLPFLDDAALQEKFTHAKALMFPSEIEGFGLPAIEAYYLGTPVCFVRGTSVEEVLGVATDTGGFDLDQPDSLTRAIHEVLAMPEYEIYGIGLKLRETYAAAKVVDRMREVFEKAAR